MGSAPHSKDPRNAIAPSWASIGNEEGRRRAASLQFTDDFFRPALDGGARLMHHTDGTIEFAHAIIKSIMPKPLLSKSSSTRTWISIRQAWERKLIGGL